MKNTNSTAEYNFGERFLGPVFAEFCRRLWLYQEVYTNQDASALFCARGGMRLRILYEKFLLQMEIPSPVKNHDFMISRLLASKVCLKKCPEMVFANLTREFGNTSIANLATAFSPPEVKTIIKDLPLLEQTPVTFTTTQDFFWGNSEVASVINEHIEEQTELFEHYINSLMDQGKTVLLVDSGLFGSTQMLLSQGYQHLNWFGHYFGRSNYRGELAPHFPVTTGLILEHDKFSPRVKETALLKYWHLIEAPLEPQFESVRYLKRGADGSIVSNLQTGDWQAAINPADSSCFAGIQSYFDTLEPEMLQELRLRYKVAMGAISKKIQAPSKADILSMTSGQMRSNDFGRDGMTPVLRDHKSLNPFTRFKQLRYALWPEGQMVLFFGGVGTLYLKIAYHMRRMNSRLHSLLRVFAGLI